MPVLLLLVFCVLTSGFAVCLPRSTEPWAAELTSGPATGPLRVHPSNPRYFADANGQAVYLTGSHTWSNLQDRGVGNPPSPFDYSTYLDFMVQRRQNFMRLWTWEQARWAPWTKRDNYYFTPLPYRRTGPGKALDGAPKFDLEKFDHAYFARLRSRVIEARDRGIYVSIMLFNGWSIELKRPWGVANNPWLGHPFNRQNNINGIDGDLDGDEEGPEVHSLRNPAITLLQEAYLRKVIETVNDLDNVLYEIANESTAISIPWQIHMINMIQRYEASKPKQHPVLFTCAWGHDGSELWASRAEAISPGWPSTNTVFVPALPQKSVLHALYWLFLRVKQSILSSFLTFEAKPFVPYRDDPPANDGQKVVINDTDHMWGIGGTREWVWKSFLRGLNPIYMDPYDESREADDFRIAKSTREQVLQAMERTRGYARRINLAGMVPRSDLCSTMYCLADTGKEYLVYLPSKGYRGVGLLDRLHLYGAIGWVTRTIGLNQSVTLDLRAVSESVEVEWFNPRTGEPMPGKPTRGHGHRSFTAPFTGDAVLYVVARTEQL